MRVTVMTPSRTKMLLDGVETLRDVKRQIMTKTGIPARQQLVYFRGKQLKSLRRPLSAYCVRDDSTLFLVKRLGVCRCLACRNSRYIEQEEMEEERQQLQQLLGATPDDGNLTTAEMTCVAASNVASEVSDEFINASEEEQEPSALEMEEGEAGGAEETEGSAEEGGMEDIDDEVVAEEADAEEYMVGMGEEEQEVEETNGETEDYAEETEEINRDPDEVETEEESIDEVAGETEDLNEEDEEVDADEEDLDLSGEDADDEEEQETVAEEEEEAELHEAEDIEDEQLSEGDDENHAEGDLENNHEEDEDEDATILYSLVTGREDNPVREELELTTRRTREDEDEEEEHRPAVPMFTRQAAFEEDGANSVGEEDPDITGLEDEEELAQATGTLADEENLVSERVEDLLLSMTRPTPDPEGEEDPLDEPYPEDDPLFDPPDEEDPLLASRDAEEETDAGYRSGDELDHAREP